MYKILYMWWVLIGMTAWIYINHPNQNSPPHHINYQLSHHYVQIFRTQLCARNTTHIINKVFLSQHPTTDLLNFEPFKSMIRTVSNHMCSSLVAIQSFYIRHLKS